MKGSPSPNPYGTVSAADSTDGHLGGGANTNDRVVPQCASGTRTPVL